MKTNYIHRLAVVLCFLLGTLTIQAARLNGIRIESSSGAVIVYLNGEQVCSASGSCFIANLTGGYYEIRVYEARFGGRGEHDRRERLLFNERVRYSGSGVKDIFVRGEDGYRPPHPGGDIYFDESMSRETFELFYRAVKEAAFDSERNKLIETALLTSWFTSTQCRRIVDIYTFDNEKIRLMQQMYPRIVDKEGFFIVIEALTFQLDKNKISDFIKKYHSRRN